MNFLWFGDRAGYCAHWAASGVGAVYARFYSCCRTGKFGGNKGQRTCLLLFVTAAPGDMMLIFCCLCYGRLQLQLLQLFFLML